MHKVAVQGIQFDRNGSYMEGPAEAPDVIRQAIFSKSANMWTESNVDLSEVPWYDHGDLHVNDLPSEQAFERIQLQTEHLIGQGYRLLTLGGDHSIVNPVISAHASVYGPVTVLHVDAHGDIYENFDNNPYSHASPFARLFEKGVIKGLTQYGVRTLTGSQRQQQARYNVQVYEAKDYHNIVPTLNAGPFYLSLDLDAMDPAFCPGVSHYEPGGLSVREVLNVVNQVGGILIGADIVELNPRRDINGMTAMVGARIAKELLARLLWDEAA